KIAYVCSFSCFHLLLTPFVIFFFSSRRRHTRSKRDWSSDVCSSDLTSHLNSVVSLPICSIEASISSIGELETPDGPRLSFCKSRSEERRVGKECRSRW